MLASLSEPRVKRRRTEFWESLTGEPAVETLCSTRQRYAKTARKATRDKPDAKPLVSKSFHPLYPDCAG